MAARYIEKKHPLLAVVLFLLTVLLTGCEQKSKPAGATSSSDSVAGVPENNTSALLGALLPLFEPASLPFNADTAFIAQAYKNDSLTSAQLRLLINGWGQNKLVQTSAHFLNDFYEIDSVKALGKYQEWCEKLDIGMTQDVKAYALKQLELNATTRILVWALVYHSYPACPHFAGTTVFYTVVYNGAPGQSFLLGEVMGGGDPPSSMESTITGLIGKEGHVELNKYELMDEDMDQPTVEVAESRFVMNIGAGTVDNIEEIATPVKKIEREKIDK
jgi:hypothetical protein